MKETIFVVDSSGTYTVLTDFLQTAGFNARAVAAGAITTLGGPTAPSVILLSLDPDEFPTFPTLVRLRGIAPDITLIVLSASSDFRVKTRPLELGADAYIEEPFEPLELLARVRSFVRRQKLRNLTVG